MHKVLGIGLVMLVFASTTVITVDAAAAESADSPAKDAAYGAGSAFTTLLYVPFKTTFCIVGGVTSALTLPFGGTQTAGKVATAACGGTWIITPDTLRGQKPVQFIGSPRADTSERQPSENRRASTPAPR